VKTRCAQGKKGGGKALDKFLLKQQGEVTETGVPTSWMMKKKKKKGSVVLSMRESQEKKGERRKKGDSIPCTEGFSS